MLPNILHSFPLPKSWIHPCDIASKIGACSYHSINVRGSLPFTVCRGEIQAWDLQSLLIKPVQRVLKYPLLVGKLVELTADSHPDYKAAHSAKDAVAKVARDINEIKRRKDLGKWGAGEDIRGQLGGRGLSRGTGWRGLL